MARKTVRVVVPHQDPTALIALMQAIAKKHEELGATSPIKDKVGLDKLLANIVKVSGLQTEIEELRAKLQVMVGDRDKLLGIADGQTSHAEATLRFDAIAIRDMLLGMHRGNENALETWGFKVVVGTARTPTRKVAD
ncbi:MAG TPA: hypothetical protein VGD81_13695, partial [Opitutaceae bacterium]